LTQQPKENIIQVTRSSAPQGGRHQIGTPAGFGSEQVAGFTLECMAGFVGIRISAPPPIYRCRRDRVKLYGQVQWRPEAPSTLLGK
jgi:hypothetical protein